MLKIVKRIKPQARQSEWFQLLIMYQHLSASFSLFLNITNITETVIKAFLLSSELQRTDIYFSNHLFNMTLQQMSQ